MYLECGLGLVGLILLFVIFFVLDTRRRSCLVCGSPIDNEEIRCKVCEEDL